MTVWIIHLISAIQVFQANRIPSVSSFEDGSLFEHPALLPRESGSVLFNKYTRALETSLQSIINAKDISPFHLDALVFALENTRRMMTCLREEEANPVVLEEVTTTFDDYEKLLSISSTLGIPTIDSSHFTAEVLEKRHQEFQQNYDIIYVDNIFDEITMRKLLSEISRLWKSSDIEANCNLDGVNRMGGYVHHTPSGKVLDQTNSLYSLIYGNESLRLWMSAVTGVPVFPADFPIELREYGKRSRGMPCHADTQMYSDAAQDFEVVVTLSNRGKCQVYWYDRDNIRHSVWPAPNSITIVRANASVHCVSETKGGSREILKFIMVGNHLKHRHFFQYVENHCPPGNFNLELIEKRRAELTDSINVRSEL